MILLRQYCILYPAIGVYVCGHILGRRLTQVGLLSFCAKTSSDFQVGAHPRFYLLFLLPLIKLRRGLVGLYEHGALVEGLYHILRGCVDRVDICVA